MPSPLDKQSLKVSLDKHFGSIEDPRFQRTIAHNLLDIIVITLFAVLSGADSWVAIEAYGEAKEEWLQQFLTLPNSIPSHDTFARVWARLEPAQLEENFREWVSTIAGELQAQVVAIDGKTMRGSYDREKGVKQLQMVSAWASESRLVLGQCAVESKSNEITAIPKLLEQLSLKDCIITIDAMGTQKTIAKQIRQAQADYILALKGNQGTLAHTVTEWFEHQQNSKSDWLETAWTQTTSAHHRTEIRQIWQVPAATVLTGEQLEEWQDIKTLVMVSGKRKLWNQTTQETRYFISSMEAKSLQFAEYIRSHWGIENQLHWCLDVVFNEDDSRIRRGHAPQNMSVIKRFALNLLRQEKSKKSLKMKRYHAAMDNQFLLKILTDSSLI